MTEWHYKKSGVSSCMIDAWKAKEIPSSLLVSKCRKSRNFLYISCYMVVYDRAQFQVPDRTDFRYLKFHLPNFRCISCIHVTSNKNHMSSSFHVSNVKFPVFMSETEMPCVFLISWSEHQISYIHDNVRKLHMLSYFHVLKISDFWLHKMLEFFLKLQIIFKQSLHNMNKISFMNMDCHFVTNVARNSRG